MMGQVRCRDSELLLELAGNQPGWIRPQQQTYDFESRRASECGKHPGDMRRVVRVKAHVVSIITEIHGPTGNAMSLVKRTFFLRWPRVESRGSGFGRTEPARGSGAPRERAADLQTDHRPRQEPRSASRVSDTPTHATTRDFAERDAFEVELSQVGGLHPCHGIQRRAKATRERPYVGSRGSSKLFSIQRVDWSPWLDFTHLAPSNPTRIEVGHTV